MIDVGFGSRQYPVFCFGFRIQGLHLDHVLLTFGNMEFLLKVRGVDLGRFDF